MFWKRKQKDKLGQSIIQQLRNEKRSCEEFEIMLHRLSMEEIIQLKLELCAREIKDGRLFGFPIWTSFTMITKEALFKFAMRCTTSKHEAARFLGIKDIVLMRWSDKIYKYNKNTE